MLECFHFSRTTGSPILSIMMGVRAWRYSRGALKMYCSCQCGRVQTPIL